MNQETSDRIKYLMSKLSDAQLEAALLYAKYQEALREIERLNNNVQEEKEIN